MLLANVVDSDGSIMFSKTGKYTSEKFFILRKKDEILYGVKEKKKEDVLYKNEDNERHNKISNKIKKYIQELDEQKKKREHKETSHSATATSHLKNKILGERNAESNRPNSGFEPFRHQVGRFDNELRVKRLGRNKNKRRGNPPPGMYNPKLINSHVYTPMYHTPFNGKYRIQSATTVREDLTEEDMTFDPDKTRTKVKGYVRLKDKTWRKPYSHGLDIVDVEGKQFLYRDVPRVSSKYRYEQVMQTGFFFRYEEGHQ